MSNLDITAVYSYSRLQNMPRAMLVAIADSINDKTGLARVSAEYLGAKLYLGGPNAQAAGVRRRAQKLIDACIQAGELIEYPAPGHPSEFLIPLLPGEWGYDADNLPECHDAAHICNGRHMPIDSPRVKIVDNPIQARKQALRRAAKTTAKPAKGAPPVAPLERGGATRGAPPSKGAPPVAPWGRHGWRPGGATRGARSHMYPKGYPKGIPTRAHIHTHQEAQSAEAESEASVCDMNQRAQPNNATRRPRPPPPPPARGAPTGGANMGAVYLLHFDRAYVGGAKRVQHYLGWAKRLDDRLAAHAAGRGARLTQVVGDAGIGWRCVRVWRGATRADERYLRSQHHHARLCPVCNPVKHRG